MTMFLLCRSSNANDINKRIYGGSVPVLDGETLSLRSLVCHAPVLETTNKVYK